MAEETVCRAYFLCYTPDNRRSDHITLGALVLSDDDTIGLFQPVEDWERIGRYITSIYPGSPYSVAMLQGIVADYSDMIAAHNPYFTTARMEEHIALGKETYMASVLYWRGYWVSIESPAKTLADAYRTCVAWPPAS